MKNLFRKFVYKISILSGFFSFFFHSQGLNPILVGLLFLFLIVYVYDRKWGTEYFFLFFPFSSGILIFLFRFFYWDQFDFLSRTNNLLWLSIIFSLFLAFRRFRLLKKCLYFFNRLPLKRRLILIFVISEVLFILAASVVVKKGINLVGDEPHYLVLSQSLARDFDLNVFNQYARDKYREFINMRLHSHAKVGMGFKKWYSFHLPGLSITLVPFFWLKIPIPLLYFLIRSYLGLFAALLALLVYVFSLKLWKNKSLSIFITGIFLLTSPIFFMSIHVFAEVQVLLLLLSALYLLLYSKSKRDLKILMAGFLLGITVFWGMKYVIFIYGFCVGFFFYLARKKELKKALLLILFPLVFQLLFFSYLYHAYGNFSPMSIYTGVMSQSQAEEYYGNVKKISLKSRVETLLDYFFDQRDGLLLYNPFYFFFFPGLILALRRYRKYFPHLLISLAGFIYILYHGYSTVRPGSCPQARYLVPVLWILILFSIVYYRESRNQIFKKCFLILPLYSLFVVVYQVFNPLTIYQTTTHDYLYRPGLMFQQWSNIYLRLSNFLPSFVKLNNNERYLPNIIFLFLVVFLVGLSLVKMKRFQLKFMVPLVFVLLMVVITLFPRIPLHNPVLVQKTGTIPHLFHGKSMYPTKTIQKKFLIGREGLFGYSISTRKKAPLFIVEMVNGGNNDLDLELYNYDILVKKIRIFPNQKTRIFSEMPQFRKLYNRFFYQFTVRIKKRHSEKIMLNIEIFPTRKEF